MGHIELAAPVSHIWYREGHAEPPRPAARHLAAQPRARALLRPVHRHRRRRGRAQARPGRDRGRGRRAAAARPAKRMAELQDELARRRSNSRGRAAAPSSPTKADLEPQRTRAGPRSSPRRQRDAEVGARRAQVRVARRDHRVRSDGRGRRRRRRRGWQRDDSPRLRKTSSCASASTPTPASFEADEALAVPSDDRDAQARATRPHEIEQLQRASRRRGRAEQAARRARSLKPMQTLERDCRFSPRRSTASCRRPCRPASSRPAWAPRPIREYRQPDRPRRAGRCSCATRCRSSARPAPQEGDQATARRRGAPQESATSPSG